MKLQRKTKGTKWKKTQKPSIFYTKTPSLFKGERFTIPWCSVKRKEEKFIRLGSLHRKTKYIN